MSTKYLFVALSIMLSSSTATTAVAELVIEVFPSGDLTGTTDQANIQAALTAAGTAMDAKVELGAGSYYVDGGVKATGFRGLLEGSGVEDTLIIALGEGDPANRGSVLLIEDGSATIRDLSILVPEGSSYLDSSPFSFVSDGGAAIDIHGGSAEIENVGIESNGPFLEFGPESLETGILVHNCDGNIVLKDSVFNGVKRAFIFNPEEPSECELTIESNLFDHNRVGIVLFGGNFGIKGGNDGGATISDNTFLDTLVYDVFGVLIDYPVLLTENNIHHPNPGGNAAISFDSGNALLAVSDNETGGLYVLGNVSLFGQTGDTLLSGNTINGASTANLGAILIEQSDDVLIVQNNLENNPHIPGWNPPSLSTQGAYAIWESTNVQIQDEELPDSSEGTCQVLHVPLKDPTNIVDGNLGECEFGF